MVAEVGYFYEHVLETLQGGLGCNRRVEGLCSCVSYQQVHLEVRYVKLNLAMQSNLPYPGSVIWTVPITRKCP